jgi:hypothetical protein
MPAYPINPNDRLYVTLRDIRQRVSVLEAQMANRVATNPSSGGSVFDSNVLWNSAMESGITNWVVGRFLSGYTAPDRPVGSVEGSNPLAGIQSLRIDESANAASWTSWFPTNNNANVQVGSDVFATAPGEQWRLSAMVRATQPSGGAQVIAMCGTTPVDAQSLAGANTNWVIASSSALTAGVTVTLDGLATVPAGRNYIGFLCVANGIAPAVPWTWWMDTCVMQRKL